MRFPQRRPERSDPEWNRAHAANTHFAFRHQNSVSAEHIKAIVSELSALPPAFKAWEAIHPQNDAGCPVQNPSGLYAVRLFWMGAWRRVMVDDHIGLDSVQTERKRRGQSGLNLTTLVQGLIKCNQGGSNDEIWQSVLVRQPGLLALWAHALCTRSISREWAHALRTRSITREPAVPTVSPTCFSGLPEPYSSRGAAVAFTGRVVAACRVASFALCRPKQSSKWRG